MLARASRISEEVSDNEAVVHGPEGGTHAFHRHTPQKKGLGWCLAVAAGVLASCVATEEYCRHSISRKLDLLHAKYQAIFDSSYANNIPNAEKNEDGVPVDLQAICDELSKHGYYAPWWNLEFLTGDFDLAKKQTTEGEMWEGRCGGFADYFLTEASKCGYRASIYYAALPKNGALHGMHFYAIAEKGGTHFILDGCHSDDGDMHFAILPQPDAVKALEYCNASFLYVRSCEPDTPRSLQPTLASR